MSQRTVKVKQTVAESCPECGCSTTFIVHSEQVTEDCCEVWVTCGGCGYDPTLGWRDWRVEDVWDSLDESTVYGAIQGWNDAINDVKT